MIMLECLLKFETKEDVNAILGDLGFKESLPKNYKGLLNDKEDFLLFSEASVDGRIAKLKEEIKEEKNQYKRNRLKSKLSKLRKELKALQKHLSFVIESEKSKLVSQQPVNQRKEQVRGLPVGRYKNWQVLFTAFTFSCLGSYRDFSPLKKVMISMDWVRMVNRLVPVLGAGSMILPKYRLLGLEVWAWQTCLKWRNINTPTQAVQSNTVLYSLVDQEFYV